MRIMDEHGNEMPTYDPALGKIVRDRLLIAHHEAVAAVTEVWHYETEREYPNGGKDVRKVIDTPGVRARDAWDEYEDILRYIPYTAEELAEMEANRKPSPQEQIDELREALEMILAGVTE